MCVYVRRGSLESCGATGRVIGRVIGLRGCSYQQSFSIRFFSIYPSLLHALILARSFRVHTPNHPPTDIQTHIYIYPRLAAWSYHLTSSSYWFYLPSCTCIHIYICMCYSVYKWLLCESVRLTVLTQNIQGGTARRCRKSFFFKKKISFSIWFLNHFFLF